MRTSEEILMGPIGKNEMKKEIGVTHEKQLK